MLSIILSAFVIPTGEGQDPQTDFKKVHVNMKAEDKFSPELDHQNDTEAQRKLVQAQYTQNTPVSRVAEWTDAGIWESDAVKQPFTMQGQIIFNLWYQIVDDGYNGAPDWRFEIQLNGEQVAYKERQDGHANKDEPEEVTDTVNFPEPVEVKSGDKISYYIQYSNVEDVNIYYDNQEYDSGAAMEMDCLIIWSADTSSAKFSDAWGLNWEIDGKYWCTLDFGGSANLGNEETVASEDGQREGDNGTTFSVTKIKWNNIEKGEGAKVVAYINYGPDNGSAWSMEAGSGAKDEESDDELPIAMIGGVGLVAVLGILGVVLFMRKKNAEDFDEDDEEYDEEDYEEEEEEEE